MKYETISKAKIPATVRFDVPAENLGQIIEVAYGGVGGAGLYDAGAPYKRVTDQSLGMQHPDRVTYYRLVPPPIRASEVLAIPKTSMPACYTDCPDPNYGDSPHDAWAAVELLARGESTAGRIHGRLVYCTCTEWSGRRLVVEG